MNITKVLSATLAFSMLCTGPLFSAAVYDPNTKLTTVTGGNGSIAVYSGTMRISSQDTPDGNKTIYNAQGQRDYVIDKNNKVVETHVYDTLGRQLLIQYSGNGDQPGMSVIFDPKSGCAIQVQDQVQGDNTTGTPTPITTLDQLNAYLAANGGGHIEFGASGIPKISGNFTGNLTGISFTITGSAAQADPDAVKALFGGNQTLTDQFMGDLTYAGSANITLGNAAVEALKGTQDQAVDAAASSSNPADKKKHDDATYATTNGAMVATTYTINHNGVLFDVETPFTKAPADVTTGGNGGAPTSGGAGTNGRLDTVAGPNTPTVAIKGFTGGDAVQLIPGDNGSWVVPVTNVSIVNADGSTTRLDPSVVIYVSVANVPNVNSVRSQLLSGKGGKSITVVGKAVASSNGYVMTDMGDSMGLANSPTALGTGYAAYAGSVSGDVTGTLARDFAAGWGMLLAL